MSRNPRTWFLHRALGAALLCFVSLALPSGCNTDSAAPAQIVAATAAVVSDVGYWREVQKAPTGRRDHAMTYDSARGKVVLFGGLGLGFPTDGGTWEWDGTSWALVSVTGPSPRSQHAMAYDSARGKVVLFGGHDLGVPGGNVGDTWEWDGTSWTQVATTGPSPRFYAAMAYDSVRHKTVLVGGYTGVSNVVFVNDTWEWDGVSWTLSPVTTPVLPLFFNENRRIGALAYDSARGKLVLVGNQTWEWDGVAASWTRLTDMNSFPFVSINHAIAYDVASSKVVLFGGGIGAPMAETWEWDGASWTRRLPAQSPPARELSAMAYDSLRGKVVIFGGGGRDLDDTFEWDGANWTELEARPRPRSEHAMAYDAARGQIVLFSGRTTPTLADTWTFDGTSWRQRQPSTVPPGRYDHAMAYEAARGKTLLFGGTDSSSTVALNDTWEWDGANWMPLPVTGPPGGSAAMAYDSARDKVVLVVGGQTWEWGGTSWTQVSLIGPSSRNWHAMAYDSARHKVVLFGGAIPGTGADTILGDTWEWDGTSWTLVSTTGPSPRFQHGLTYDGTRSKIVVFGGTFANLGDTWEWDGTSWTMVSMTGPAGRHGPAMAYDSARGKITLFGGALGIVPALDDTWESTERTNGDCDAGCDLDAQPSTIEDGSGPVGPDGAGTPAVDGNIGEPNLDGRAGTGPGSSEAGMDSSHPPMADAGNAHGPDASATDAGDNGKPGHHGGCSMQRGSSAPPWIIVALGLLAVKSRRRRTMASVRDSRLSLS